MMLLCLEDANVVVAVVGDVGASAVVGDVAASTWWETRLSRKGYR